MYGFTPAEVCGMTIPQIEALYGVTSNEDGIEVIWTDGR